MKMKLHLILAAAAIALAPLSINAASLGTQQGPEIIDASNQPQVEAEAQRRRGIEMYFASIKSERDLSDHLATKLGRGSPLDALSAHARERFIGSLTFNGGGITGYRYDDLEAELSVSQAFQVLSLFGAQDTISKLRLRQTTDQDVKLHALYAKGAEQVSADHFNYYCFSHATCKFGNNFICMSGCISYTE